MRFLPLLIALAGLLLVAGATAKPGKMRCSDSACADALKVCIEKCGIGSDCKLYCECKLFGDKFGSCRMSMCFPGPDGCDRFTLKRQAGEEILDDEEVEYNPDQRQSDDEIVPDDEEVEPNPAQGITVAPGGGYCRMYGCGNGMDICKKKCGLGAHCQGYCDCKLHSDPKSLCRKSGCVKAPKGCDKYNRMKRQADVEAALEVSEPVSAISAPFRPCVACRALVRTCVKECGLGAHCQNYCECSLSADKRGVCNRQHCLKTPGNCLERSVIPREEIDATPSPEGQLTDVSQSSDAVEFVIPYKAGIALPTDDLEAPTAHEAIPPPTIHCFKCFISHYACVKKCGLDAHCSDMCKCEVAKEDPTCNACPSVRCPK